MPIIPDAPIEVEDREQLILEIADAINEAITGEENVGPQEVARRILTVIDDSGLYYERPKPSTGPRLPGHMLDMDAIIAADREAEQRQ